LDSGNTTAVSVFLSRTTPTEFLFGAAIDGTWQGLSHEIDPLLVYGSLIRQHTLLVEAKLPPDPSIFACCF
jgi:hypothetical protein